MIKQTGFTSIVYAQIMGLASVHKNAYMVVWETFPYITYAWNITAQFMYATISTGPFKIDG